MVTTQAIVDKMNSLAGVGDDSKVCFEDETILETQPVPEVTPHVAEEEVLIDNQTITPDIIPGGGNEETEPNEQINIKVEQEKMIRQSERIAEEVKVPSRYALLTKMQQNTTKMDAVKEKSKLEAIQKEILQIFQEL
jgi:hypothetical protein